MTGQGVPHIWKREPFQEWPSTLKHILALSCRPLLRQVARGHSLLAFDYDGTLAPIVSDPSIAEMRASTVKSLRRVARLYPVAIVSGRAVADVVPRLQGISVQAVLGNHGIEPSPQMESSAQLVRSWMPAIAESAAKFPGVVVEDKRHSVSIHYRKAVDPAVARDSMMRDLARLGPEADAADGKYVINVVPHDAPDKGDALVRLCNEHAAEYAVFAGDDVTDEDAFARTGNCRLLGVRIGRSARSRAEYFLQDQNEMDEFLEILANLRSDRPE